MRNKILFCFGQWHLLVPVDQSSISSRLDSGPQVAVINKSSSGSFFSRYSVSVTLLELGDSFDNNGEALRSSHLYSNVVWIISL